MIDMNDITHVRIGTGTVVHSVGDVRPVYTESLWTSCNRYPALRRWHNTWMTQFDVTAQPGPTTCKACLTLEDKR